MWCQSGPPISPDRGIDCTLKYVVANYGQTTSVSNWLLVTACGNLLMLYPTVPLPTPYRHLFSQNRGPYPQNLHGVLQFWKHFNPRVCEFNYKTNNKTALTHIYWAESIYLTVLILITENP